MILESGRPPAVIATTATGIARRKENGCTDSDMMTRTSRAWPSSSMVWGTKPARGGEEVGGAVNGGGPSVALTQTPPTGSTPPHPIASTLSRTVIVGVDD